MVAIINEFSLSAFSGPLAFSGPSLREIIFSNLELHLMEKEVYAATARTSIPMYISGTLTESINNAYSNLFLDAPTGSIISGEYDPQTIDVDEILSESNFELYQRIRFLCAGNSFQNNDFDYFIKLLEDIITTVYFLVKAKSKTDYGVILINFIKLRFPGPLLSSSRLTFVQQNFDKIFATELAEQTDDVFVKARNITNKFEEVRKAPIFKKLHKFAMFILSSCLFEKAGIDFDLFRYSKLEAEYIKKDHSNYIDFVHCMMDTTVFICERGQQCMLTGSMDPILHCQSTYEAWFAKVAKLKLDALVLGNPDPHLVDPFNFLADLEDTIEKGDAIYRHAVALGEFEKKTIRGLLSELKLIKCNETTKRASMKLRKSPFALLIYGGSGVAKSKFTEMLFFQYGKLRKLQVSSEFMYTRNSNDPFWSGFRSYQWCGLLDDVAFMHPNKAVNGDPSMMEVIQVINNIALVPNQASLEDKGKTPVKFNL